VPGFLDPIIASLNRGADWLAARCARLPRHTLAWSSIGLALVLLLSVNVIASNALRNSRVDLTQQNLFTISPGTRSVLRGIDEPISVRLYYSKRLGEASSAYARYFERVRALLEQYRDISGGKVQLAIYDPEPFSDAEDRAVAAGLRGVRLNQEGEVGYFGLTGTNATDNDVSIPFFTTDREPFLEYDITKLIYGLANPKKRVVGLISGIPIDGGMNPMAMMGGGPQQLPPQVIMEQIRDFFEVRTLNQDLKEIPADIDVLMIAQPDRLTADAAYAIDQFVLGGGKVLAFVDPVAEVGARRGPMGLSGSAPSTDFIKLLKAWGVEFDPKKGVGDIATARRVQFGGGARPVVTEYVAWMGLDQRNIDSKDVLSGGIEHLNLASAGFLTKVKDATTQVSPILVTSPQAMEIGADKLGPVPDPVALLRAYKPGGKPLMLAARISGDAKTAFPDGAPKPPKKDGDKDKADKSAGKSKDNNAKDAKLTDAKPDAKAKDEKAKDEKAKDGKAAQDKPKEEKSEPAKSQKTAGRINVIVVADTDMLADQFWVDTREFLGQHVAIPNASNSAFVVNALDNLSGSESLIALRARGTDERPFKLVAELRRDAERRYREKEQVLTAKLKEVQDKLAKFETGAEGGNVILSESDRQSIDKFRADMLSTRRELREVKRALREDIDRLDGWIKFANIALVPLLIGAVGVGFAAMQRRRGSNHAIASGENGERT
jgi:gliding motility-associatede transport system auxiliary component